MQINLSFILDIGFFLHLQSLEKEVTPKLLYWQWIFKMTSNFWRYCAISALQISKNYFARFDFFVEMKLVSTEVHINAKTLIWLLQGHCKTKKNKSKVYATPEKTAIFQINFLQKIKHRCCMQNFLKYTV